MKLILYHLLFIAVTAVWFNPALSGTNLENAQNSNATSKLIMQLILNDHISDENQGLLSALPAVELMSGIENFNLFPTPSELGLLKKELHWINDTLEAPYYLYIPTNYNPSISTPLVVWLHGGVSRKEFIEDPAEYFDDPSGASRATPLLPPCSL